MKKFSCSVCLLITIVTLAICIYDAVWIIPQIEQSYFIPPIHNVQRFIAAPTLWFCLGFGLTLIIFRRKTLYPIQKYLGIFSLLIYAVYTAFAVIYLTTMTNPLPTITKISFFVMKAFHQTGLYRPVFLCLGILLGGQGKDKGTVRNY